MLLVSNNQIKALEEKRTEAFVQEMVVHFKKMKPKLLPQGENKLVAFIRQKIEESKQWKLQTERDVEKYIYLSLHYPVLNKKPFAKYIIAILTVPEYTGTERIDALHIELVKKGMFKNN